MPTTLESVLLAALVLLVLIWWRPSLRAAAAMSRGAGTDWRSVLLPLAAVALFVLGLILLT